MIVAERFDDLPYRRSWVRLGRLAQALGAVRSVMDAGTEVRKPQRSLVPMRQEPFQVLSYLRGVAKPRAPRLQMEDQPDLKARLREGKPQVLVVGCF